MAVAHVKKYSALWAISFRALHACIGTYKWYHLELAVNLSTQRFSIRSKTPTVHWSWKSFLLRGFAFDWTPEGKIFLKCRLEFCEVKTCPRGANILLVGQSRGRGKPRWAEGLGHLHMTSEAANTVQLILQIFSFPLHTQPVLVLGIALI